MQFWLIFQKIENFILFFFKSLFFIILVVYYDILQIFFSIKYTTISLPDQFISIILPTEKEISYKLAEINNRIYDITVDLSNPDYFMNIDAIVFVFNHFKKEWLEKLKKIVSINSDGQYI